MRKSGQKTEDFVYPNITLNDFDSNTIKKTRKLISVRDRTNNWDNLTDEEILKNPRFYKKNFMTGEIGFTLSSILLFGKRDVIPGILSWYKVDVLKKIKDIERYDDRFICEDNLIESYEQLIKYITSNIDKPFYLNKDGITYDAVSVVVREIVSNILIHREFLDGGTPRILLYKDKIIAENPNSPIRFSEINISDNEPYSKNSTIAYIFRRIGYADEAGSGYAKIKDACFNFFKSTPKICDKYTYRCEVNLISDIDAAKDLSDCRAKILEYINVNGSINNEQCRNLFGVERSKSSELLNNLVSDKVVFRHGNGKATYYDLNKDDKA